MKNQNQKAGSQAFKKIKTLEDACSIMGVTKNLDRTRPKKLRPLKKLAVIMDAINKGSKLDRQYIPYFKYVPEFSFDGSGSNCGGSIFFATKEMAQHAGRHFAPVFREMMNA